MPYILILTNIHLMTNAQMQRHVYKKSLVFPKYLIKYLKTS